MLAAHPILGHQPIRSTSIGTKARALQDNQCSQHNCFISRGCPSVQSVLPPSTGTKAQAHQINQCSQHQVLLHGLIKNSSQCSKPRYYGANPSSQVLLSAHDGAQAHMDQQSIPRGHSMTLPPQIVLLAQQGITPQQIMLSKYLKG